MADRAPDSKMESTSEGQRLSPKGYYRCAIVLAVVILLLVLFQYQGHGLARRAGLVATAEPLTELYFSHPNSLPATLRTQQKLEVSFRIVNLEGSRRTYTWTADFTSDAAFTSLAKGSAIINNSDSRQITLALPNPNIVGAGIVEINLASPHESINFHLNILSSGRQPSETTTSGTHP